MRRASCCHEPLWPLWPIAVSIAFVLGACSTTPLPVASAPEPHPVIVPPAIVVQKVPPKIGLALGGGAARGFAHIGVIQVLEEAGIKVDMVSGTSAGSLVAAIYASGKSGSQLQQIALTMDESTIADWTLPLFSRGVLRGEALARYVGSQVGGKKLEDMTKPLGIVATDLSNGRYILFQRGDTATAVRASSAVPGVFQPVRISGREYVDGGLVSPVPVRAARALGAELVIAVDISTPPEGAPSGGTLEILLQTFSIMGKSITTFELEDADLVVRPNLNGVSSADFSARKRSIEAGRQAMLTQLAALRAAILAKTR